MPSKPRAAFATTANYFTPQHQRTQTRQLSYSLLSVDFAFAVLVVNDLLIN